MRLIQRFRGVILQGLRWLHRPIRIPVIGKLLNGLCRFLAACPALKLRRRVMPSESCRFPLECQDSQKGYTEDTTKVLDVNLSAGEGVS